MMSAVPIQQHAFDLQPKKAPAKPVVPQGMKPSSSRHSARSSRDTGSGFKYVNSHLGQQPASTRHLGQGPMPSLSTAQMMDQLSAGRWGPQGQILEKSRRNSQNARVTNLADGPRGNLVKKTRQASKIENNILGAKLEGVPVQKEKED